ncbi:MAG: hypothetical protein HYX94_09115 [Chloroflexi bacterium]|nr:hypothetical protein [Chloroflexota bacterium]
MLGGYMGKVLRVDLSSGKISEQPLPAESVLRQFIGGWGLGLKLLYDRLPLGLSATDPRNPLIFMNGPLVGTGSPMSNNNTLATLNASTGYTAGRAHSHGFWGPNLKFAGYDGLIIEGASETPVYLWIHDGKAEVREANPFWGQDTHESEDLIRQAVGESKASVAAIGPAGESVCSMALIENDKNHSFSHSGVGAIMGSKKLKAIAVHGTGKPVIADEGRFREIRQEWVALVRTNRRDLKDGVYARNYVDFLTRWAGGVITRNWQSNCHPEYAAGMSSRQGFKPRPCYACPAACSYDVEILEGPHKGHVATLSGGLEAFEALGSNLGIAEEWASFYLPDIADRLGFEGGGIGAVLGLAFECYEKGLLTKEDTDGLELRWGDAEAVEKLMRKIAAKEGIGRVLAEGAGRAAEIIGGGAPEMAIHIKNSCLNLHNWKSGFWGTMFGQIIGGGSGWQDLYVRPPLRTHKGMAGVTAEASIRKYWMDSAGTCYFSFGGPEGFSASIRAVAAVTGWDLTEEEVRLFGERVLALERVFNARRGLTPEDDFVVPKRVIEAPKDGPAKGLSMEPYLKGMAREYYRHLGWDEKTGKPLRGTLERLGLEDVIGDVWR